MKFKAEVREKLGRIDSHMAVYNEQLKVHISRTAALEDAVKPLQDSHTFWKKFFTYTAGVLTTAAATASIYHYLLK